MELHKYSVCKGFVQLTRVDLGLSSGEAGGTVGRISGESRDATTWWNQLENLGEPRVGGFCGNVGGMTHPGACPLTSRVRTIETW